jgi:hypothetical protein
MFQNVDQQILKRAAKSVYLLSIRAPLARSALTLSHGEISYALCRGRRKKIQGASDE